MERRFTTSGIDIRADEGKPKKIMGYGARYYDGSSETEYVLWDDKYERVVERVVSGAFDRAAREDDVRGMYNHRDILARTTAGTMRLKADSKGLAYEIDLPNTTTGRDVAESIGRGDVTGSSFAFDIPNEGQRWTSTTDKDGKRHTIREILQVRLFDTGPVDYPAYSGSSVGLRAAGDIAEARSAFDKHIAAEKARVQADIDQAESRAKCLEIGA